LFHIIAFWGFFVILDTNSFLDMSFVNFLIWAVMCILILTVTWKTKILFISLFIC
jgi:hypothetical protein